MNLSLFIARRYLIAKKTTNAVNLITAISILGVAVGTAAMIAVLSGFNGLESLIRSFYNTFDPDLKIEATTGKYLPGDTASFALLSQIDGVENISFVLEDKALLRFRDKEFIATIKGVDQNYHEVTRFTDAITRGDYFGRMTDDVGILGIGVAYHLNILRMDFVDPLQAYVPRQGYSVGSDPTKSVNNLFLYPIGTFSVQPDYDVKYVVTPLAFARRLFEKPDAITSIEIKCTPGAKPDKVKTLLAAELGDKFTIKNRNEQQATIFRVIKIEGLATFLILAFILTIASFGILGSLIMLILEKKEDMFTLKSMGADHALLRKIFFTEGLLITAVGCFGGLLLGIGLVIAQQKFGLISLGQGYAVDAYPMQLRAADIIKIAATVFAIGSVVSWLAVRRV